MTPGAAALLCGAGALLLWPRAGGGRAARLARLIASPAARAAPDVVPAAPAPAWRRALVGATALAAAVVLLGDGPAGWAAGLVAAVLVERRLRRQGRPDPGTGAAVRRELPVACDLLAVCLAAGAPLGAAVGEVAAAVPGPLGRELAHVAALLRLGAEPRHAWADTGPDVAPLARTVARAGESGSAVVPALRRLAADTRAAERSRVEAAVRRAGVWVLAPLGVCFLPAFLCLGVVPLVLGIASDVLG